MPLLLYTHIRLYSNSVFNLIFSISGKYDDYFFHDLIHLQPYGYLVKNNDLMFKTESFIFSDYSKISIVKHQGEKKSKLKVKTMKIII